MDEILITLKALSDQIRLRIVILLLEREACVCELMEVFGMAQSKLSHHLLMLKDAGILRDKKRGKWNYYSINKKNITQVNKELLSSLSSWLKEDGVISRDHLTFNGELKCKTPKK